MNFRVLLTIMMTLCVVGALPVSAAEETAKKPEEIKHSSPQETMEMLQLFGDVFEKVRAEYVEPVGDKKLLESAINGMLTDLDPHSSYLNKEAFDEMRVQTKGEFGGLGIEVTMKDRMVYVVSPIDDTPATKAGIKAGDYISNIDDKSVVGMTINDAVKMMRGKPGSDVKLTVLREGKEEPMDMVLKRAVITIHPVKARAEQDVAYLRITSFSEQTSSELREQFKKQRDAIGKDKLRGVVLDLRNNPGGLLNQAIEVSDMFMERGEIVSTRGRKPEDTKRFNASKGDDTNGLPIVVLINGGSASASEIVAGALQDQKRAVIMGQKSFGKGSVQTIIPLEKDSAIRLTTSRYYTPSGRSIQAEGITPDIEVQPAKVEFEDAKHRTTEASLKGHLDKGLKDEKSDEKKSDEAKTETPANDNAAPKTDATPDDKKDGKDKDGKDAKPGAKKDEDSLYNKDYQLARAVDLIRAVSVFNQQQKKE